MHRLFMLIVFVPGTLLSQDTLRERGSQTAKNGFKNEDDIRNKFNSWQTDADAQAWLKAMGYRYEDIQSVTAEKPFQKKSDVDVRIKTATGEAIEGISIKLVSNPRGFNQIDKRWLKSYAKMWGMPDNVVRAMKLYLGETPPVGKTKRPNRMYLSELTSESREAVISFFRNNKARIISDLLTGDGEHAAEWMMVTLRSKDSPPRWTIRSMKDAIRFYSDGDVVMTSRGNLKLGRISMQRKGGDNGRPTANMLQFKLNPAALFSATLTRATTGQRAMYIDGFAGILGNRIEETKLLEYAKNHELDVLLLYDLHRILNENNAADTRYNARLARFIAKAKRDYGIQLVGAIGEHAGFFARVIDRYNNSRSSPNEKFDIYNLEFEFWIRERVVKVYNEPYLKPRNLSADENGAFQFFLSALKEMRALATANSHTIQVEAYIGWTDKLTGITAAQAEDMIAQNVDQLRVHAYRTRPDLEYTSSRLRGLTNSKPDMPISIIFSAEKQFMQSWLKKNGMQAAEADFLKQLSASRTLGGVSVEGFTYYSYAHAREQKVAR